MQNHYKAYIQSPIGIIEIVSNEDAILQVNFVSEEGEGAANLPYVLLECISQLNEYFKGERKDFTVKIDADGTPFQKKVWSELLNIPHGTTTSYLKLANAVSDARSIRAVGGANGKNKIAILIPCHRVIGSDNELVGYSGGKWRKQWLLEHEGS